MDVTNNSEVEAPPNNVRATVVVAPRDTTSWSVSLSVSDEQFVPSFKQTLCPETKRFVVETTPCDVIVNTGDPAFVIALKIKSFAALVPFDLTSRAERVEVAAVVEA